MNDVYMYYLHKSTNCRVSVIDLSLKTQSAVFCIVDAVGSHVALRSLAEEYPKVQSRNSELKRYFACFCPLIECSINSESDHKIFTK